MMKAIKRWLRFGANASLLDGKIERVSTRAAVIKQELSDREAQLRAALVSVEDAKKTIESLEHSLDAVREQLTTAESITIPTLVAAHKLLVDRWEADSRVLVMRTSLQEGS